MRELVISTPAHAHRGMTVLGDSTPHHRNQKCTPLKSQQTDTGAIQ